jgi:putative flavoprotein involved in K+ transport
MLSPIPHSAGEISMYERIFGGDRFVAATRALDAAALRHQAIAHNLANINTPGYKRQEELVRKLFGEAVEKRVGTIWGFGEEQELRNMYTRTGQPGLWLIAGGLAQCRIGSKHLALQIKAIEEGLLPR